MFGNGKRFSEVIGEVGDAGAPNDYKLPLRHSVLYPVEAHVNGLTVFLLDAVLGDADRTAVVAQDDCWRLGVSEVIEDGSQLCAVLSVHEQTGELGLCSGGDDNGNDGRHSENGTIR